MQPSRDRDGRTPPATPPGRPIERILGDLKDRLLLRAADWGSRGPEDPGWALLEVFAEALSELKGDLETLEERVEPRLLESLGDEPRWAAAASTALVFVPDEGIDEPVRVPRGRVVSAPRADGKARVSFETTSDAWCSPSKLLRVIASAGDSHLEVFPYPQSGWQSSAEPLPDGESGALLLFGERTQVIRHLYLGDPLLFLLEKSEGPLVLEWPGNPQVLFEGTWEYSVRGGWRKAPIELEEVRAGARRGVRMRVLGPLPDLAEVRIESASLPWIRLSLAGDRRTSIQPPRWTASGPAIEASGFPRPAARILSHGGGRWEDHSLSAQKILPVEPGESWDPSIYLGWESPTPASLHWSLAGSPAPPGWGGPGERRRPRFAWEHTSGRGFRPLDVEDGTEGFTRSGCVSWDLPEGWTPREQFGERLYWVRARWLSGAYPSPPAVRAVLPNAADARQRRRVENHVLEATVDHRGRTLVSFGFLDGEPERFDEVEVKAEGGEWRRLVRAGAVIPGGNGVPTEDDGRFTLLRLPLGGFLLHLGVQWFGRVLLRVPLLRASLGARGNVPAGSPRVLETEVRGVQKAVQPLPAGGGMDPETPEAFRRRVRAEWKTGDRAVTPADFQRLLTALDPEVLRVETAADPREPTRILAAVVPGEPFGPGRFSPARLEWLSGALGRKAPLGTTVEVIEPTYLPVEVIGRARDGAPPPSERVRRLLEESLRSYFHPLLGGPSGEGFPAEKWLNADDISTIISSALDDSSAGKARSAFLGPREDSRVESQRPGAASRTSPREGWDQRAWRFELRVPEGRRLLSDPADGFDPRRLALVSPLVIPVLERLSFDAQEIRPVR
ncbi:MAG TPA: baseplate J/gp47 family protein [Planctomycetota bacterium]|nr:baseplate J/gp47 family protein [Planctomycetota bacterium]